MKRLFIPKLGTVLTLAADWTFNLSGDGANDGLFKALRLPRALHADTGVDVTLAAGTELVVRKYYIRLGQCDADHMTFAARLNGKSHRFFAKLCDVNRIHYAFADTPPPIAA